MKKKMKHIISGSLALLLIGSMLTGCGSNTATNDKSKGNASDKVYKIGISQFIQHDALDSAYEGFVDGLKEAGYEDGVNIKFDYQNGQGDQSNCSTIATKFVNDNVDLILAIGTPAAQAVANATTDIPVLITAITDPAYSKIVESNEAPGGNISGTSDLTPVKEQLELLVKMLPDAKKVALLYSSAEANSTIQINIAKKEAEELGLETIDASVSNSNEIQQVVQSLVGKVNAIYVPTDNMIASGISTVTLVTEPNKIPVICGEEGMVRSGGLATYGINYYNLGKQTAAQAVKILEGTATTDTMPIEYITKTNLVINKTVADSLGITIPDDLLKEAELIE